MLRMPVTEITEPQHTWTFEVPCGQRYVVNGLMSENSGKSIVVALLSTYITHRVLKMQKPTRFYNVGDNQILQGTFVALTQAQAKDTLWEPYYGFLLSAPWFQRYHTLIRRYEALYGVDVMKIRDTFVLYRHRNLLVYPAGPDKRTLRGRCLVGNTLVNTGAGFLQFDEMISRRGQHRVEDMHIDSHRGRRAVSHTYSAMSKTLKAVTKNGFHVEGTPLLFTGDTLFPGGPGNTTFDGGDFDTIITSIDNRLFTFPDDTVILPGHGLDSTIGTERPHLAEWVARGW